jgi:hypothetical protein
MMDSPHILIITCAYNISTGSQQCLKEVSYGIPLDVYSHLLPGLQEEAMSKLNEALSKREGDEKNRN